MRFGVDQMRFCVDERKLGFRILRRGVASP